jgi:acetoin utilization protein AcuB
LSRRDGIDTISPRAMTTNPPTRIPSIKAVMTPFPWKVRLDDSLSHATAVMREHNIRHLPVTDGDQLVGIVTERDIGLVENAIRGSRETDSLQVSDACMLDAYVVDLSSPLDRVLAEMAERHIGSALVVKRGKLAGIFTSSDACHHFGRFLAQFFESGGNDAA